MTLLHLIWSRFPVAILMTSMISPHANPILELHLCTFICPTVLPLLFSQLPLPFPMSSLQVGVLQRAVGEKGAHLERLQAEAEMHQRQLQTAEAQAEQLRREAKMQAEGPAHKMAEAEAVAEALRLQLKEAQEQCEALRMECESAQAEAATHMYVCVQARGHMHGVSAHVLLTLGHSHESTGSWDTVSTNAIDAPGRKIFFCLTVGR